ncbi:hypothetical protein B0H63DRAFT_516425 [Podospora didyma]|uniref:BTB domain-containing protein n=1 Tax=Podospora didyma TaxID=330526 RepID=A0AAE0P498_9PEZI|nr:hypothetical protein B0H63DRAFT_516425 [Podospora didyma]
MDPPKHPAKQRAGSYAEALRGTKANVKPKPPIAPTSNLKPAEPAKPESVAKSEHAAKLEPATKSEPARAEPAKVETNSFEPRKVEALKFDYALARVPEFVPRSITLPLIPPLLYVPLSENRPLRQPSAGQPSGSVDKGKKPMSTNLSYADIIQGRTTPSAPPQLPKASQITMASTPGTPITGPSRPSTAGSSTAGPNYQTGGTTKKGRRASRDTPQPKGNLVSSFTVPADLGGQSRTGPSIGRDTFLDNLKEEPKTPSAGHGSKKKKKKKKKSKKNKAARDLEKLEASSPKNANSPSVTTGHHPSSSRHTSAGPSSFSATNMVDISSAGTSLVGRLGCGAPSPVLDDAFIEEKIQTVVANEAERVKKFEERAKRTKQAIEDHDNGKLSDSLYQLRTEWDVLLFCDGQSFRVHHDILCRESGYFARVLPPKDPNGGYIIYECKLSGYREMLASGLEFMYEKTYDNAVLDHDQPWGSGICIQLSAFKYICGITWEIQPMMDFALKALRETTEILKAVFPASLDGDLFYTTDLSGLYHPLATAQLMVFHQGFITPNIPLRLAMAKLIDVCIMYLVMNPGFLADFENQWMPSIWEEILLDHNYFRERGELDPLPLPGQVFGRDLLGSGHFNFSSTPTSSATERGEERHQHEEEEEHEDEGEMIKRGDDDEDEGYGSIIHESST